MISVAVELTNTMEPLFVGHDAQYRMDLVTPLLITAVIPLDTGCPVSPPQASGQAGRWTYNGHAAVDHGVESSGCRIDCAHPPQGP